MILSPKKDAGNRFLLIKDNIWHYVPKLQQTIKIAPSIGAQPSWIAGIVMAEACWLGLLGVFAGIFIMYLLVGITGTTGINLAFYSESMRVWGTGTAI